jgi:hypothetical protein
MVTRRELGMIGLASTLTNSAHPAQAESAAEIAVKAAWHFESSTINIK